VCYVSNWFFESAHMSAGTGGGAAGTFAARALLSVAKISAFVGISGSVLNAALYDVDGGERAVIFDRLRGVLQTTSGEGTHLLVPLLQYPIIFDVRTRPRTISSATGTKDLQQVNLSLRVLARPMREKLPEIYKVNTCLPLEATIRIVCYCSLLIDSASMHATVP